MAERLRGLTVIMVIGYILYELVSFFMSGGGTTIPLYIGVGVFFIFGAALGYKAYDDSASSSDMIETSITFVIILAVLSFLAAVAFFMISSLGKFITAGSSINSAVGNAGATLLEFDNFMRIMGMLIGFVGCWFFVRMTKESGPAGSH